MDPDFLKELLGPDYTGSYAKLVEICEEFDRVSDEVAFKEAERQIKEHEEHCRAHK